MSNEYFGLSRLRVNCLIGGVGSILANRGMQSLMMVCDQFMPEYLEGKIDRKGLATTSLPSVLA